MAEHRIITKGFIGTDMNSHSENSIANPSGMYLSNIVSPLTEKKVSLGIVGLYVRIIVMRTSNKVIAVPIKVC